ncbi:MAG: tRNA-dihydrouridine synthase [Thermoguttaceae bacterium]|nr:tRNA-dihydrouridine synthase [Thermoguttaceae bacterium]
MENLPSTGTPPLKIGSLTIWPPLLSAPMAGFTNFAYRQFLRQLGGVGLIATEMVSARSFVYLDQAGQDHPDRLWGIENEPQPLAVQIWDNLPETLAQTAKRLVDDYHVSVIDLNFGCPAPKIAAKSQSGSRLLKDPDKVECIIRQVVAACGQTPVTAKIRLGVSFELMNACEVACAVEEAGAAALTVHGRTASQMYTGQANWEKIAEIKPCLKKIPLIGNGDIKTVDDAINRLRDYPVDGIMIGRAGLDRPWLFRQICDVLEDKSPRPDPSDDEQKRLLLRLYDLVSRRFGSRSALVLMRSYACHYFKGKPGARGFRTKVAMALTQEEFIAALNELNGD